MIRNAVISRLPNVTAPVKKALHAISILWIGALLGAGLAFLTQVVLARELSPAGYGVFASALATATLLTPLAGFGVQDLWLKVFGAEGWGAVRWLPASFRFVKLSTLGVLIILLTWATWGPHDTLTRQLLCWMLPVTAGYLFIGLVGAKLQLEEHYKVLTIWQLLPNLSRLLLVLLVLHFSRQPDINAIAVSYALVAFAMIVFGFIQLRAMGKGQFSLKGHPDPPKETEQQDITNSMHILDVARGAWPFGLGSVFHLVYFQSNIVLLKYLDSNEAAGLYNVAFTVMVAVYLLPSTIYQKYLLPKVHRWANHDRQRFLHVYRVGNGIMLLLGGITAAAMLLLTPWFIPVFFGTAYKNTVGLLTILAFCVPLRFLACSVGATLVTQEHMHRKNGYMGIVAVINVGLNIVLIPPYGVKGAAVATLCSEIVLTALYLIAVRRHVFGPDAWRGWTIKYKQSNF